MTSAFYQKTLSELQAEAPEADVASVSYQVGQEFFDAQKEIETDGDPKGFTSVIVLSQNDQIVLARKAYGPPGWALPGGGVDPDETFHEGAQREILEELGIRLENFALILIEKEQFISPSGDTANSLLAVFAGTMRKFALPPLTEEAKEEGLELALFDLDDLPEEMTLTDREKIEWYFDQQDDTDA